MEIILPKDDIAYVRGQYRQIFKKEDDAQKEHFLSAIAVGLLAVDACLLMGLGG